MLYLSYIKMKDEGNWEMKKTITILLAAALVLSLAACGGNGGASNTPSGGNDTPAPTQGEAIPELTPELPSGFSEEEIEDIDALLQGTWTVNAAGAEPVYVFDGGKVTVEAVVSGASGGINTGSYEIEKDSLGNGQLSFVFDNGVEGSLMFTYEDETLTPIFAVGDKLYAMGKTSDDVDTDSLGSFWDFGYFVDDFDQPTDEVYITNKRDLSGTFSNSATTDSKVSVAFMVYEYDSQLEIAVILYEYGRNPVVNTSERNVVEYDILMRAGDGSTHEITGTMYQGGDRIFIDWDCHQTVLDALSGSGDVAFRITQSDRTTTSYLFTVEASNFANTYEELFEK